MSAFHLLTEICTLIFSYDLRIKGWYRKYKTSYFTYGTLIILGREHLMITQQTSKIR